MSNRHPTRNFSIRLDESLCIKGDLLKSLHPHVITHSKIYEKGLKTIIAELTERGEQIPNDPVGALIEIKQSEIKILSQEVEDLQVLQKKQSIQTQTGSGLKPGYKWGEDALGTVSRWKGDDN